MGFLLKGALIEYRSDFLGPLPNVVLFQFNPERVMRTLEIPQRPTGASSRETSQAGDIPIEKYDVTAQFSAADMLAAPDMYPITKIAGIGPQLAALEMMVRPSAKLSRYLGTNMNTQIDAVGDALGDEKEVTQPIPREQYPRILFIWGTQRVLPIIIDSMSVTEVQYDRILNPIEAEVKLGFTVISPDPCTDDAIARGAFDYSMIVKEGLAMTNLANTATQAAEIVRSVNEEISF